MKARDYYNQYVEGGETPEAIAKVFIGMFEEMKTLAIQRRAMTDSAALSVYHEMNTKWRAFTRRANAKAGAQVIDPQGFEMIIRTRAPDLWEAIQVASQSGRIDPRKR